MTRNCKTEQEAIEMIICEVFFFALAKHMCIFYVNKSCINYVVFALTHFALQCDKCTEK